MPQELRSSTGVPREQYRRAVDAYLGSPRGSDTPLDIAVRLYELPAPQDLGLSAIPSPCQLHATRLALEDLAYLSASEEAPMPHAIAPDETGVYRRALLRLRQP